MPLSHLHILPASIEPRDLVSRKVFTALWKLRPSEPQKIEVMGWEVPIPRRQKAFGRDYTFSGRTSRAEPVPNLLNPFLEWGRGNVDPRANGLLVNWYDAAARERIGPHRDEIRGLVEGSPIVTISLGAPRIFRLREFRGSARLDIMMGNGSVLVLPWKTNRGWKHEVLHRADDSGCRISVTLRAFSESTTSEVGQTQPSSSHIGL